MSRSSAPTQFPNIPNPNHLPDEGCKFTKVLKTRREEEGSSFDLDCAIEKEDGSVTWWFNDIEITPRTNEFFDHFEFIEEKRKRFVPEKKILCLGMGNPTPDRAFYNFRA